ncbi:hypothetical protein QZH41_015061 [Actinostola sp. cb2023]|nr:hypothetical protein QZH41_015061 [Actinostola sp. cb2023]
MNEYLSLGVLLVGGSLLIVVVLFVIVVLVYFHYQHTLYQHIPGPRRDSFFSGNVPSLQDQVLVHKRAVSEVWFDWYLEYGPVYVFWVYCRAVVVVADPESIKTVLITLNLPKAARVYGKIAYCFGQRLAGNGILTETDHGAWKKKRCLLDKAFHRSYLMNLMGSFNGICDVFMTKIGKLADGKTAVEMSDEFGRVTLDVIGKVGFGIDTNAIDDANSPFPSAVSQALQGVQSGLRNPFWMLKFWTFPYQNKVIKSIVYLRQFAQSVIEDRVRLGDSEHKDVLAYLVSMSRANDDYKLEDIVDDFGTFFIAGQETTSNQLAFTLFEILSHPHIQNRILEEIEDVLGSRNFIEYEDLGKLEYLGMTLKEGLRKHPPISSTQRMLLQQHNIGGYEIPAMTPIHVSFYITQKSPNYWEDPETFDPMRFSLENKIGRSSTQYMPFSVGPRTCIGKTLAEFEAKVIMARLFQEFKLELVPGQTLAIVEQLTVRPRDGVKCVITRRQK